MKRHIPPVVSFFAGLLTVLGIMLVPALIGIAPVWAQGGWQLVLENDGTVSSSSFNQYTPPPARTIHNNSNPLTRSQGGGNVAIDVTVKVKLVWSGSGLPTTPPQSVKITANAFGYAPGNLTGPEANNGFDPPQIMPDSGPAGGYYATSDGTHLVKVPNGSAGTTIEVGTYIMRAFGPASGSGPTAASIHFEASADTRTVSISRAGAHDEWVEGGITHGDTIWSTPSGPLNWQGFDGSLFGSWSRRFAGSTGDPGGVPDVGYVWNPQHSSAYLFHNDVSMPYGGLYLDNNGDLKGFPNPPAIQTVSYTVTDYQDGATATDSYILHIHEPWENLQKTSGQTQTIVHGTNIYFGSQGAPVTATWTTTVTITATVTFNWNGSLKLGDFMTLGGAISPGFSVAVGQTFALSTTVQAGYRVTPQLIETKIDSQYTVDRYDTGGKAGIESGISTTETSYTLTFSAPELFRP